MVDPVVGRGRSLQTREKVQTGPLENRLAARRSVGSQPCGSGVHRPVCITRCTWLHAHNPPGQCQDLPGSPPHPASLTTQTKAALLPGGTSCTRELKCVPADVLERMDT